ncbi:MAG: fumarylacetoacetate hydrolase family protein [Fimbriimonadaceae bacterium]|nr:fumarylacetoacetate hydrolase family protein [Fimbriimonadaceae bacterium]
MIDTPTSPSPGYGIENLPLGRCARNGYVIRYQDLALPSEGLGMSLDSTAAITVNQLRELRSRAREAIESDSPYAGPTVAVSELELLTPVPVRAFIDFYSGIHHASNVGRMFRPDMPPLLPNYRHLPVAYNGRASSVVPSGVAIRRPYGITRATPEADPEFGPTRELDFELELGVYFGSDTAMGQVVPIDAIESHLLGVVLVNDWSARDVQRFEYQPLGPFLAKSFATSVSPWLVAMDALEPYRAEGPAQTPPVLPHLQPGRAGHYDIRLGVELWTPEAGWHTLSETNARELYWSFAQQLAHQSSNGTPLEAGDLYATGTISGPERGQFGSLLELTWRGSQPIELANGATRTFLADGDRLRLTGMAGTSVNLGAVEAEILPAG